MTVLATITNINDIRRDNMETTKKLMTVEEYYGNNRSEYISTKKKIKAINKGICKFRANLILAVINSISIAVINLTNTLSDTFCIISTLFLVVVCSIQIYCSKKLLISTFNALYTSNPLYKINDTGKQIRLKDCATLTYFVYNTIPISMTLYYIIFLYMCIWPVYYLFR